MIGFRGDGRLILVNVRRGLFAILNHIGAAPPHGEQAMYTSQGILGSVARRALAGVAVLSLGACAGMPVGHSLHFALDGGQEVPPVSTVARGWGAITVEADRSLRGGVTVSRMQPTAAHIHEGARGANGPAAVPLVRTGADGWSVPAGATLSEAQFAAYRNGDLYVNVHSAAHPGGEIRGQLAYPPLPQPRQTWW